MLRPLTLAVALAGVGTVTGWVASRRLAHLVVAGHSMAPTLLPGDRLVAVRLGRPPRPGDLAITRDPRTDHRVLIKRVHAVGDGWVELRGDNAAASTDSRTFGAVRSSAVAACRVWRYHPAVGIVSARAPRWREQLTLRPVR